GGACVPRTVASTSPWPRTSLTSRVREQPQIVPGVPIAPGARPVTAGWRKAVVRALFARRVVGWALRPTLERERVVAALQDASAWRPPPSGLLHHSDRGRP
ncbi:MAG: IS3 family transposase, partial [Chloroflexaceae bacterium]|nr:IS3 family transposase [Chloroflexaceae bacterium]